jgi:hypothetical protein
MNTTNPTQYTEMLAKFRAGEITEAQWREFVDVVFRQRMKENLDVFVRMKNR